MNGQNNQTPEAFIGSFGHPRKAELATMLLSGEATIESLAEAGFGRITVLEMARGIRNNVIDMKEFDFEWPRDVEVEVAPAPVRTAEVATEETVVTPDASIQSPVAPTQEEIDEINSMFDYTITEETLEYFNASIAEGMEPFKVGDVVKIAPTHPLLQTGLNPQG